METGQLKQTHKFVNDIKRNLSFKNSYVIMDPLVTRVFFFFFEKPLVTRANLTHHITSH